MKITTTFIVLTLMLASCGNTSVSKDKKEKQEIVEYGEMKVDPKKAVSVDEMLTCFENNGDNVEFTFKGKITETCSKAGCWVNVDKGNGEVFMVRFKNHFTIPIDTKKGTEAIFHGYAHVDTISVKSLQHFAEDAGKSKDEIAKITSPSVEMGFQADGIKLLKK